MLPDVVKRDSKGRWEASAVCLPLMSQRLQLHSTSPWMAPKTLTQFLQRLVLLQSVQSPLNVVNTLNLVICSCVFPCPRAIWPRKEIKTWWPYFLWCNSCTGRMGSRRFDLMTDPGSSVYCYRTNAHMHAHSTQEPPFFIALMPLPWSSFSEMEYVPQLHTLSLGIDLCVCVSVHVCDVWLTFLMWD